MLTVPSTATKPPRRPFGLNAIIILQLLTALGSAILLLIFALVMLADSGLLGEELAGNMKLDSPLSTVDVLTMAIAVLLNLLCAVGLWRRQRWAWYLTMLQLGLMMITDLYSYFTYSPLETYAWSMLFNVLMVFYLNQREVRAIFMDKAGNDRQSPELLASGRSVGQ